MNKDKALQIIKQTLDQAIKMGIAPNLETSAIISQAWEHLKSVISVDNGKTTNDN